MERKTTKNTRATASATKNTREKSTCCNDTKKINSTAKASTKNCGGNCTKTTRSTKSNVKSCS